MTKIDHIALAGALKDAQDTFLLRMEMFASLEDVELMRVCYVSRPHCIYLPYI